MKKITLLIIAIVLFSVSLSAQYNKFKFGANTGVGTSWVRVNLDEFSSHVGLNVNAHVFADYYFTEQDGVTGNWGASFGLGVNRYSSVLDAGGYNTVFFEGTDPTSDYQRFVYSNAWQERVALTTLSIPVGALYKRPLSPFLSLRTFLGFNIELPLGSSYKREQGSLSSTLYYPAYMKDPSEAIYDVPEFGCYDHRSNWPNDHGSLAHTLDVSLYFQAGVAYLFERKQPFTYRRLSLRYGRPAFNHKKQAFTKRKISITADLYMGVGLKDITGDMNTKLLGIDDAGDYGYHSPTSYASTHTIHAGLKVGLIFGDRNGLSFTH